MFPFFARAIFLPWKVVNKALLKLQAAEDVQTALIFIWSLLMVFCVIDWFYPFKSFVSIIFALITAFVLVGLSIAILSFVGNGLLLLLLLATKSMADRYDKYDKNIKEKDFHSELENQDKKEDGVEKTPDAIVSIDYFIEKAKEASERQYCIAKWIDD